MGILEDSEQAFVTGGIEILSGSLSNFLQAHARFDRVMRNLVAEIQDKKI